MNRNRSLPKPLFFLLAVLLAALCLFACLHFFGSPGGKQIAQDATIWSADLEGGESVPGIKIPGYGTLYFTEGQSRQDITLYNPEGNPCYFEFALYLDSEADPIYTSDLVEPGKAITEVTLEKPLPAGTYELTVQIAPYALENQARMNGSAVKTTLIVQ